MKKKVTAAELMASLNADENYLARKQAKDAEFRCREDELAQAEAPLVHELCSAGVTVGSVWDFVNGKVEAARRIQALPILLAHLKRPYPDAIRDGIARAMALPAAKFAWPVLVRLYREERERRTKDGLAVAISSIADDDTLAELIALIRESTHGESRVLLLGALERSRFPQARKVLMDVGGDPELYKESQRILRRLKRLKA